MTNPAPLMLTTNMISFEVLYQDVFVGRAVIPSLVLVPGKLALA